MRETKATTATQAKPRAVLEPETSRSERFRTVAASRGPGVRPHRELNLQRVPLISARGGTTAFSRDRGHCGALPAGPGLEPRACGSSARRFSH